MCIMEVRKGQESATMAQAMAHNLSTVERDLEMFAEVLTARGDDTGARAVRLLRSNVEGDYRFALAMFAGELAGQINGPPIGTDAGYMPAGTPLAPGNERIDPTVAAYEESHANPAVLAEWKREHAHDAAMIAALPVSLRYAGQIAARRAERFETR